MGSSVRCSARCSVRLRNRCRSRRLVSDYMIDRRSDNVTAEEGDRRTWELAGQLVQIDSSDPGAYEGQIEQWIYEWFTKEIEEKAGALKNQIELVQREVMPGRFNLTGKRTSSGACPCVHMPYGYGDAGGGMGGRDSCPGSSGKGRPPVRKRCL